MNLTDSPLVFPQLGDSVGESTARMNVSDLRKMLGLSETDGDQNQPHDGSAVSADGGAGSADDATSADATQLSDGQLHAQPSIRSNGSSASARHFRVRRQSMEQLDLIKVSCFRFDLVFYTVFCTWSASCAFHPFCVFVSIGCVCE